MKTSFSALILFFLVGCGWSDRPPLDEQTYISIRAELEIIHTIHTYTGDTDQTAQMLADLKAAFHFTADEFLVSHRYYEKNLNDELARFEQTIMRLTEERQLLEQQLREEVEQKRVDEEEALNTELDRSSIDALEQQDTTFVP